MKKIPKSVSSVPMMMIHILGIPVFFLGFILIYESGWMVKFLEVGNGMVFNALMLSSILMGIEILSRVLFTTMRKRMMVTWWGYGVWSIAEMLVFGCFAALYMALVHGTIGYFPALARCLWLIVSILPFGYALAATLCALIKPDEPEAAEEDLVRFTDSTGRLKIVIAHGVILYIEAQENYINIHYLDGDKQKEYSLRQSMRGIEDLMEKHGIIRCQRSYFVNPSHVKVLRRDKEGFIQAELDVNGMKSVPVSPRYYEELSKML